MRNKFNNVIPIRSEGLSDQELLGEDDAPYPVASKKLAKEIEENFLTKQVLIGQTLYNQLWERMPDGEFEPVMQIRAD